MKVLKIQMVKVALDATDVALREKTAYRLEEAPILFRAESRGRSDGRHNPQQKTLPAQLALSPRAPQV